ncbi:uncharacterized protein LOC118748359 [Rhagoletis pomonella]|uniref:uncharacterized protein LOC118748359 n=1 Tax=Rhagoletis pomonella TaxID=28610 RepID=UPI00178025A5|nr:uncharacterized protein LOC118748359 [Rhagoletis pomonella]
MDRREMEVNQCRLCCRYHPLRFCHAFRAMTPDERYESARIQKYCVNCLATSHTTGACSSADSCHRCGMAYHTMLHRPTASPPERHRQATYTSPPRTIHTRQPCGQITSKSGPRWPPPSSTAHSGLIRPGQGDAREVAGVAARCTGAGGPACRGHERQFNRI